MALSGETAKAFDDTNIEEGTQIQILVVGPTDDRVVALPPADPEAPTPAERTWVRCGVIITRSDGLPSDTRWSDWQLLSTARYPLLSASAGADCKEMHGVEKTALGL